MRTKFIAGNWKMYKTAADAAKFADEFEKIQLKDGVRVAICAPYTQLETLVKKFAGTNVKVGAQNMHFEDEGAYTGEISAAMLNEIGITYCIIGHSERRGYFGETDETVNKKLHKAFASNILPILCVGESLEERDGGMAEKKVGGQIKADLEGLTSEQAKVLTIAYEPIWAIGTGRTATPDQAEEMCAYIRKTVKELYGADVAEAITIQYGGSVKPANTAELMAKPDIDGALVGGASLKPADFSEIIKNA